MNRKFNAFPLNDGRLYAFTAAHGFSGSQTKACRNAARGFTLAEVLITLTIIGVIAAITIPNLMQKHRKHEVEVGVRTAYSIIQNAVKMSIVENGPVENWVLNEPFYHGQSPTNSCSFANKYIFPYLKIQQKCNSSRGGCFIDDNNGGTWHWMNGTDNSDGNGYGSNLYCKVKLQNGMSFGVWWSSLSLRSDYANGWAGYHKIAVDVNGGKGTTTAGSDVFFFDILPPANIVRPSRPWSGGVADTTNINTIYTTNQIASCNINKSGSSGYACARVLELNHWQFPNNYPIKKF